MLAVVLIGFQQCDEVLTQPQIDDLAFNAELVTASFSVSEKDPKQTITVEFDQELPTSIRVNVTVSGTAAYGVDYTTTLDEVEGSYFISIPAGSTSKSFSLTPIDNDDITDGDRTAIFSISTDDDRVTVNNAEITVTIENDDTKTEIELFFEESVQLSLAYMDMSCSSHPVVSFENGTDGYPESITYSYPFSQAAKGGTRPDYVVETHYDSDSIWFTGIQDVNVRGVSEEQLLVVGYIENGKVSTIKRHNFYGGRKRVECQSQVLVLDFEYDGSGRVSTITGILLCDGQATEEGGEVNFVYTGNEVDITFVGDNTDRLFGPGEGPQNLTIVLDGKNNPFEGYPMLAMFSYPKEGQPFGVPNRINWHIMLPGNWISGVEGGFSGNPTNDYTYNSNDFPIGSTSYFVEGNVNRGDTPQTYNLTWQYNDMEGGSEPMETPCNF